MKTVKINVFEAHRDWLKQHQGADEILCNTRGEVIQVVYTSPIERWRGLVAPNGTVDVPDMDYYRAPGHEKEMKEILDELEQRQTLAFLKEALNEDRLSNRPLFPLEEKE